MIPSILNTSLFAPANNAEISDVSRSPTVTVIGTVLVAVSSFVDVIVKVNVTSVTVSGTVTAPSKLIISGWLVAHSRVTSVDWSSNVIVSLT